METTVESQTLIQFKGGCSYCADFMYTMLAIEREVISKKSHYIAIHNDTYVKLANALGIRDRTYSSPNNTGNVCEALCWLAYEQGKYKLILSIAKFAADVEFPGSGVPGHASAVVPGPAPQPCKRSAQVCGLPVVVATGPAAAKVQRKQPSAPPSKTQPDESTGSASLYQQASAQKDVQQTAASASGHTAEQTADSASGRTALPTVDEFNSTRAEVQDCESSEDEEDDSNRVCMSTWTKDRLKYYAHYVKLNKHVVGRQEDMEKQANWFDEELKKENARRQQRSKNGLTLEMLRKTATIPHPDLPAYLEAYLALCGSEPEVWKQRHELLAQEFKRPWLQLKQDMQRCSAEPKQRDEAEVTKALKCFQLAFKEACYERHRQQEKGHYKVFIRDIFGSQPNFKRYLYEGVIPD